MTLIEAQIKLKTLDYPILQTSDVSACLKISRAHASKILGRLAAAGIMVKAARGLWAFVDKTEPLMLPENLTAPLPSYVSLQTALYYHGMISQIPEVIYAVSLARTRKYKTPLGVISLHHIVPEFFFDFQVIGEHAIKIASPEKALLDILYLSPARSLLFQSLPELELQSNFNIPKALQMVEKIPSKRTRTLVKNRLEKILQKNK